jgi:hypothetical protein
MFIFYLNDISIFILVKICFGGKDPSELEILELFFFFTANCQHSLYNYQRCGSLQKKRVAYAAGNY